MPCIRNESDLVFEGGVLSTFETFVACVQNVDGPKLIPAIYNGTLLQPVQLRTGIELNNIGVIDPAGALVTLDIYLNFYWQDERLDMPIFWDRVEESIKHDGVRLERIFRDSAGSFIWLPDIFFHDGITVVEHNYALSINASNVLNWRRHIVVTLSQQQFSFEEFPFDTLDITIRYGSMGYTNEFLNISLMDNSISDLISYDGTRHFYMNSEWKFLGSSAHAFVFLSQSQQTDAVFVLPVTRYANGVVVRLAIPITMLLILAGATFWVGHPESRITATTGLLIAITAIYIVLIGNVPFVGYATRIDSFVLVMLGVLAGVIVVHVFHMLVYRHIYTDEEDTRTLVKYSQPMRFLRSLLMDWCRACCGSPDDRLKYAALSEVGEAAAMKATSRVRKDRVRGDDDSKQAASRTNREKEQMHPVLTMTMLVTQSVGRITVIPAVLQFCARMLLLDAKSLALTCHVIAFSMLAVVTVWELWCLLCKYWELQSVRDPFKELREHLMLSYDLLIMRAKHLPMLEAYSSFSHLMKMHADMLTEQRQWFEKMCVAGQLPSPNRQVGLVASQAHLMRTHDRVAKVLESSYGISVFNHPSDLGVLDEHTLAASGEVNSAYSNLLHFVHTILRIYPGIQSQISKLYGFDEKPCGAATEEVKFNDELIMK